MALFYTIRGAIGDSQLHVGDTLALEELRTLRRRGAVVDSLQADGDELEAIREQFPTIRMHTGRVVEWFGDDAVFIARHLR